MSINTQMVPPEKGTQYYAEIGDFLFATKSIEKLASGKGGWGDAAMVGITAASFTVLPAKLLALPAVALMKVIKASQKVVINPVASVTTKRIAQKTLDDAIDVYHSKPQGRFSKDLPSDTIFPEAGFQVPDRTVATAAKRAEDAGMGQKPLSRVSTAEDEADAIRTATARTPSKKADDQIGEELDTFNRNPDLKQEADDLLNSRDPGYLERGSTKDVKKYVKKPKELSDLRDAQKVSKYDQVKWSQSQIDDAISRLTPEERVLLKGKNKLEVEDYVRGGQYTDAEIASSLRSLQKWNESAAKKNINEVLDEYELLARAVKSQKINPNLYTPADIKRADLALQQIKKDFITKFESSRKGKEILKLVDDTIPENLPKEAKIRYDESVDDFGNASGTGLGKFDEWQDVTEVSVGRGPMTTSVRPKPIVIPRDLKSRSVAVDKAAVVKAEIDRLTNFNKNNSILIRDGNAANLKQIGKKNLTPSERKVDWVKEHERLTARMEYNQKLIEELEREYKSLTKLFSQAKRARTVFVSDEITKRSLEDLRYVLGKPNIKNPIPAARAEIESLRRRWMRTPASDTGARKEIAKKAKQLADYLNKLEGK
jgi:hypothetical protein